MKKVESELAVPEILEEKLHTELAVVPVGVTLPDRLGDKGPDQIRKEVKRICESGVMDGGRFVLREANNMAPCTPIENIEAMYAAGKEYGRY